MQINTIIIDDEELSRISLRRIIERCGKKLKICGEADSIQNGVQLIKSINPQLVYLDIELMGQNAFELLDIVQNIDFKIIFVTAFKDYAIRAFKYNAFDYLLKPISIEEFKSSVERVVSEIVIENRTKHIQLNVNNIKQNLSRIAIPTKDGYKFVDLEEIIRLEADGSYVTIFTRKENPIVVSRPLGYYSKILNENQFVRVHRSHLINTKMIKEYKKGNGGYVILENGDKIHISNYKKNLLFSNLV